MWYGVKPLIFFYVVYAFNSAIRKKQNTETWLVLAVTAYLYKSCKGVALIPTHWFLHRDIHYIVFKPVYLQKVELKKPDILKMYVLNPQISPCSMHSSFQSTSLSLLEGRTLWVFEGWEITHCSSSICLSKSNSLMKASLSTWAKCRFSQLIATQHCQDYYLVKLDSKVIQGQKNWQSIKHPLWKKNKQDSK